MILFTMYCMNAGGAERVTAHQANYWAERGKKVGIITYDDALSHYPLHENVKLYRNDLANVSKNLYEAVRNNLRRAFVLRGYFRKLKPTTVIAVMEEVNMVTCVASIGLSHKLIIYDVANPDYYSKGRVRRWFKKACYRVADLLVVQTEGVKAAYEGFKLPVVVLKNPLPTPPTLEIDYQNKVIVSVGRLDIMKNLALIIKAFALVNAPEWEVRIFGAGVEQANLEQLIAKLGLKSRVFLKGLTKNVYAELEKASIFAFGSKMEGYPNALLEGLSAGLSVVSTDCPFGPAEIITPEKDGLLVPNNDEKAFAAALQRLINDVHLREKLGKEALKIQSNLNIEKIMRDWEQHVVF